VPENIRAFEDLLEQWEPPEDPSEVCPPPGYSPVADESLRDEIPDETFADWFQSGDSPTKDPLPKDLFREMVRGAKAGVT
jgi:hypothetical protein